MRKIYESQQDIEREKFVRAVLFFKYELETTSSLCPYDFIGKTRGVYDTIFELKARTYKMKDVPDGQLYLTFDKYQKIVHTLVPYKKLLIMNPEGLWIGDFENITKYDDDTPNPKLIIGGRYDRNDTGDVGLHVLYPVDKLQNIFTREELLKLQDAYKQNTNQIFSAEEIQRLLTTTDTGGGNQT